MFSLFRTKATLPPPPVCNHRFYKGVKGHRAIEEFDGDKDCDVIVEWHPVLHYVCKHCGKSTSIDL